MFRIRRRREDGRGEILEEGAEKKRREISEREGKTNREWKKKFKIILL